MKFSKFKGFFQKKNKHKNKIQVPCIIGPETSGSVLEAYKSTRTNLMFTLADTEGCKRILVTSSGPGEGKTTTTTINLAITFAQIGARVLVIDADLRRPRVHNYLKLKNKVGLSQFLGGMEKEKENIIHKVEPYGIDCIVGGEIPPNPSELLMSSKMGDLLDSLSEQYDYIFVDSPPLNMVTDAVSIAKFMAGAILVARHKYTSSEDLKQSMSALKFAQVKVFGYLLNDVKIVQTKAYKKYGYGYYYSEYAD